MIRMQILELMYSDSNFSRSATIFIKKFELRICGLLCGLSIFRKTSTTTFRNPKFEPSSGKNLSKHLIETNLNLFSTFNFYGFFIFPRYMEGKKKKEILIDCVCNVCTHITNAPVLQTSREMGIS